MLAFAVLIAIVGRSPQSEAGQSYGVSPLPFVPNAGQTDPRVQFTAGGAGFSDAITPSVIREGIRTVLEITRIEVADGGADGDVDTQPNGFFARPGLLIP